MRVGIYTDDQQEMIFIRGRAKAWARSGLLTEAQLEVINGRTGHGLNRTNVFFRILFFVFACIGIAAAVGLCFWLFRVKGPAVVAALLLAFGAACYGAAEYLVRKKSFYRHGIEEALALCSMPLLCWGIITATSPHAYNHQSYVLSISLLFAAAAYWLYLRFGFLYAAVLSVVSASAIPFHLSLSPATEKILLGLVLLLILLASIRGESCETRDFAKDRSASLQALLLAGIYLALNLRLHLLGRMWFGDHGALRDAYGGYPPWFYWATYGLVYLVPLLGFTWGLRTRKRMVINAGVILFIVTLSTNKDYLGFKHYAWDPVLLGGAMIAVAIAVTRWLDAGEKGIRNGFTTRSLVKPEDHGISLADIGAAAIPGMVSEARPQPQADRSFEGGQSGGGGASGNF